MWNHLQNRTYRNLEVFGMNLEDARYVIANIRSFFVAVLAGDDEGVEDFNNYFKHVLQVSGIREFLDNYSPLMSYDAALAEMAHTLSGGTPLGITGKPGAGKSELLTCLNKQADVVILDEFWRYSKDYADLEQRAVQAVEQGQSLIVAAGQLNSSLPLKRFHLSVSPERRFMRLASRSLDLSDRLRVTYFDAFESHDDLVFGLERINAHYLFGHK